MVGFRIRIAIRIDRESYTYVAAIQFMMLYRTRAHERKNYNIHDYAVL